jgi:hypothetical protein
MVDANVITGLWEGLLMLAVIPYNDSMLRIYGILIYGANISIQLANVHVANVKQLKTHKFSQ